MSRRDPTDGFGSDRGGFDWLAILHRRAALFRVIQAPAQALRAGRTSVCIARACLTRRSLPHTRARMDETAVERDVRHYLLAELIRDEELDLERDEPIFSSGLLDSFSVTQLICFLEDRFAVKIAISEVTIQDFDTIGRILVLLRRLRADG
jgi:acyl carrier protein/D-alanine--poly(phosphoribitol) ligase subunit 2